MDRYMRRQGLRANISALASPDRADVLATMPLHVSGVVRRVINGTGYVFDELLHRGWRDVQITTPLFIVAPARSGTTMLFHQIAADPRFAATTTGNTLIRSISVTKLLRRLASKEGSVVSRMRDEINKTMATLDETHIVRIERLEEDENFFNDMFALTNAHMYFPTVHERLGGLIELDDRPAASQRAVMRRYENFVRRFLYLSGPERTYLSKNVSWAGRIGCLERHFPDARYIHIVRDPLVQLPSALELIRAVAKGAHGRVRPPEHPYWKLQAASLIRQHQRLLEWERKLPSSRWLTLRYDELIADPAATLGRVYEHFQIPIDPEQRTALSAANERAGQFRKQRRYALADYGLDPDEVREQLADVYAAYGL